MTGSLALDWFVLVFAIVLGCSVVAALSLLLDRRDPERIRQEYRLACIDHAMSERAKERLS